MSGQDGCRARMFFVITASVIPSRSVWLNMSVPLPALASTGP